MTESLFVSWAGLAKLGGCGTPSTCPRRKPGARGAWGQVRCSRQEAGNGIGGAGKEGPPVGGSSSPLAVKAVGFIRVSYCFRVGWLGPNSTVGGGGEGVGGGWEMGEDRDSNKHWPEARGTWTPRERPFPR